MDTGRESESHPGAWAVRYHKRHANCFTANSELLCTTSQSITGYCDKQRDEQREGMINYLQKKTQVIPQVPQPLAPIAYIARGKRLTSAVYFRHHFGRILSPTAYQRQKKCDAFNPVGITHCRKKAAAGMHTHHDTPNKLTSST